MKDRVITAIGFASVIALGILLQGWVLRAIVFACMLISLREMYHALQTTGADPKRWPGYLYCVLALVFQSLESMGILKVNAPMLSLTLGTLIAMAAVIFQGKVDYVRMNASIFPMLYPGLFYTLLLATQDLPGSWLEHVAMLVLIFFTASVNDVFALFVGLRFGRHKLSPEISPKKSIEGSIGGLISGSLFSVIVILAVRFVAMQWPVLAGNNVGLPPMWVFAVLGLFLSGLSQIGDLVASLVKRHCGIKDFGKILPGHGGMMDRMDGILFCCAACWIVFAMFMQ